MAARHFALAHGDGFDDVSRAAALFDWTIRNVRIGAVNKRSAPSSVADTALWSWHGSRASVDLSAFSRQQGLNVVMLGVPTASADGEENPQSLYWLAALFANGSSLFDTQLG